MCACTLVTECTNRPESHAGVHYANEGPDESAAGRIAYRNVTLRCASEEDIERDLSILQGRAIPGPEGEKGLSDWILITAVCGVRQPMPATFGDDSPAAIAATTAADASHIDVCGSFCLWLVSRNV